MKYAMKHRRRGIRPAALILATLLALAGGAVFGASAATATVYEGAKADPKGDGSSPDRDITSAKATYDNAAGKLTFTIKLAAAHSSSPVQIATGVGTLTASGFCSYPLAVVGSLQPDGVVRWGREDNGDNSPEATGDANIQISGSTVTLTASGSGLAGLAPNCAEAVLSNPDDINQVFDTTGAFAVKPRPKRPRLTVKINGPGQVKRGGKAKVKVTVRNTGDLAASKAKVSLSAKGGSVKPKSRRTGRIKAKGSSTFNFTVKAGKGGKVSLRAKASARKVKAASAKRTIKVKAPKKKAKAPKGGGTLAGKNFWGFEEYVWDRSSDILGLYFTNSKFVHWGVPKGGQAKCTRVTAKVDGDGEMQPGCLRYSYDKKTGKVRIGKAKGSYRNGNLKLNMNSEMWRIDGKTWYPGVFAKAGTKFKITLINRGYYGVCGITFSCTTWAEYLTLDRSGKFGRTRSSLTTSGGGSIPFIAIGSYPPEDRGSYQVLSNGRIRFRYDNGETSVETLTIQTNKKGRPDAAREGVLLDDVWFYKDDDKD